MRPAAFVNPVRRAAFEVRPKRDVTACLRARLSRVGTFISGQSAPCWPLPAPVPSLHRPWRNSRSTDRDRTETRFGNKAAASRPGSVRTTIRQETGSQEDIARRAGKRHRISSRFRICAGHKALGAVKSASPSSRVSPMARAASVSDSCERSDSTSEPQLRVGADLDLTQDMPSGSPQTYVFLR